MDYDLLIPLFWTIVIGSLSVLAVRRWTRKLPTKKLWIRSEDKDNNTEKKE